jgi:hypothetical protein
MENDKIEVYNYLDMHAVVNDNVIEVFSIKKLQTAFPEMDEFKLMEFEAEWRTAGQRMLNLKFDS